MLIYLNKYKLKISPISRQSLQILIFTLLSVGQVGHFINVLSILIFRHFIHLVLNYIILN
jgi:hypothetical protein